MSVRFRRCFAILVLILSGTVAAPRVFAETTYTFNLPEQALADSLRAIGQQTDMNILFEPEAVKNARSPALRGQYTVDEAIRLVLAGTKLEAQHTAASNVVIKVKSARSTTLPATSADTPGSSGARLAQSNSGIPQSQSGAGPQTDTSSSAPETSKKEGLSEIIVTGTLIHDVAPITPVTTITHDEILNQGYSTLQQVIEQLPQNFRNGASAESNPQTRQGADSAFNLSYSSGINLRGLGSNATLVLVNGQRMAPNAANLGTDLSGIPVSLIDRVEILTDGASALYGSDAVAGVVNIITRRDFSGAEVGTRAYSISDGKSPNWGEYALAGYSWGTGNIVFNVDHESQAPLYARDRSFTESLPDPTILGPENKTTSYYASLQNAFTDRLSLTADASFSRRIYEAISALSPQQPPDINSGTVDQYNASLALKYKLTPKWTATLIGQGSRESDSVEDQNLQDSTLIFAQPFTNKEYSVEGRADGPLFQAQGGDVRLAIGGALVHENFFNGVPFTGTFEASRRVGSAYGELLIPVFSASNAVPFVQGLRFDLSARYDNYSDFGRTTNPKVAAEWEPIKGLTFHASASRSFQAPTLFELSDELNYGYVLSLPDPTKGPNGTTTGLVLYATNPNLQPETAKNLNVGLTIKPEEIPGLDVDIAYFHTAFVNQIAQLAGENFFSNVLQEEAVLGSLVQRNPSLSEVTQALNYPGRSIINGLAGYCTVGTPGCPSIDASSIAAISNVGYVNAGQVTNGGVDLSARYTSPITRFGRIHADLEGTYVTTYQQRITPNSSEVGLLNTVYNPLRFKAKSNIGWDRAGLAANARLNYSNAYNNANGTNPACPSGPDCRIASWTTLDASVSYSTPKNSENWLLSGLRVSLDVTNLFNREPPLLALPPGSLGLPFDATNSNPYQRLVSISFVKAFTTTR